IQPVLEVFNFPTDSTKGKIDVKAKLLTEDGDIRGFIDGDIGEFQVDGTFDAPEFNIYDDLHFNLTSTGPSARAAGALAGIQNLPKEPYELSVKADSKDDGLHISKFEAISAGANLSATGVLPRAPTFIDADINLKAKGENLLKFQDMSESISFIEAPFTADVDLKGNGANFPDTLSGNFTLAKMTGQLQATLSEREDYLGSEFKYDLNFPDAQKLLGMFSVYLTKTADMTVKGSANIVAEGIEIKDTSVLILNDLALVNGLILDESEDKTADLDISFSGPDFKEYSSFYLPFGIGPPLPYQLDAEVDIDKDGRYISKGNGKVGSSTLNSEWLVDLPSDQAIDATVKMQISGKNLEEWLQEYVIQKQRSRPFNFSSDIRINDDGIRASNLSLNVNKAFLTGEIASRWPENPDDIDFDISVKGRNMEEDIPRFELFIPAAVPFDIDAKGNLNDDKVSIDKLDARVGSVEALIQGSASLPPAMTTERLIVSIKGDRLGDLGEIEGWELKDVPFSLSAAVTTDGERLEIDKLIAQFGPSDFTGQIEYRAQDKPFLDIDINSKNIDIGASITREQDEYVNAMLDDPSGSKDGRLIPDLEIPAELMNSFDGRLKLLVGTISRNEEKFSSMDMEANLKDGKLSIHSFKADTTLGDIKASLDLKPSGDAYQLIMNLNASRVRLVSAKASATDRIPYGGHDIDYRLVGQGLNLREIAATFNGYLWIRGGEREIENVRYSSLFGDAFTEIGSIVNPFYKKDPYTLIECERYFFEVEDGVMTTAPQAMIKTEKINVISAGVIDLKDESLKLGIETVPRKGVGVSAGDLFTPFVRIGGTMEAPKAEVDPKGSLIEGGAAYLTLGLSIIGKSLYQRWIKADKSCSEFTNIAREARINRDPDHVPPD
ncbi:MAG: hypothetical protein ACR2QG_02000, partial [Gammaproteobacteria bacterium]